MDSQSLRSLRLTSSVLLVWSLLYALIHLYWGLGGREGLFALKPTAPETETWEAANIFAFVLMGLTGFIGFGLEWTRDTRWPRLCLLFVAGAGSAIAASHGLWGIVFRAMQVAGVTEVDGQPFDGSEHEWVLWDMLAIEPWFLVEGVLLGMAGYFAQRSEAGQAVWLRAVGAAFLLFLITAVLGVQVG